MNRRIIVCLPLLAFLLTLATSVSARESETETLYRLKSRAEMFVNAVMTGHTTRVQGEMSPTLRKSLTDDTAKQIFGGLYRQSGRLQSVEPAEMARQNDDTIIALVPIILEKNTVAAKIVFERLSPFAKITGFSIHPYTLKPRQETTDPNAPPAMTPPPDYVESTLFRETELEMETGEFVLPVIVDMPLMASETTPVPGVVIIAGFGGFDADGTVGQSKPLRDIAQGLATQGIAVLRFSKREAIDPGYFNGEKYFDLEDLVLEDARHAVEMLAEMPQIDKSRLTIVGHNLGGFLAPQLAQSVGVSRVAMLAPLPAPIAVYLRQQIELIATAQGELSEEAQATIDAMIESANRLANDDFPDDEILLNYPGTIWNALQRQDPAKSLARFNKPFMIYFAGQDFLVGESDAARWEKIAADHPFLGSVKTYNELNHIFIPVEGDTPTAENLFTPGNVAQQVVNDLATFILKK